MRETSATSVLPADEADPSPDPRLKILALIDAVTVGGDEPVGREAVDRLGVELSALAVRAPTIETRDLLQGLLDSKRLDRFVDSAGVSARVAVINAQLALGFPHALEVSPEDLDFLRTAPSNFEGSMDNAGIFLAAVVSLLWNAGWAVALVVMAGGMKALPISLLAAPFAIGAGHAVATFMAGSHAHRSKPRSERARARRWYRTLAWLGLLGPFASVVAGIAMGGPGLLLGMGFALPAMITALVCATKISKLPEEEASLPSFTAGAEKDRQM